ncbi:MAG: hypothetical protein DHS20C18_17980 [Saprospiraceae bacterium]|nr:MAG: hypothetical protein DHS20C18_17980 [Saprospiraceae bacterium]
MAKNYDIKINPKRLSSEEIARHQDFDALLEQFEATPSVPVRQLRIRRLVYISSAAAAAIALLLVFIGLNETQIPNISEKEYFADRAFVLPPKADAQPKFVSQKVQVNQGGVYEYASGSRLVVPAAAFQNDRGELVEGEVEIFFKEYVDLVDLYFAGIPMTYDSANQSYYLNSAGMVEVYAVQNGQRLNMTPGKSIQVEMVSHINIPNIHVLPKYNVYLLDTVARNWVYQDIDIIQVVEEPLDINDPLYEPKKTLQDQLAAIAQKGQSEIAKIESSIAKPLEPAKPLRKNGNNPTLEFDFQDLGIQFEGDESKLYQGTIWQISPNSPAYDDNAFKVVWTEVSIAKKTGQDYELTLKNGSNELKLIANPVLIGQDYDDAMARYQQELADYASQMKEREAKLKGQKETLAAYIAEQQNAAQLNFTEQITALAENETGPANNWQKRKVINRFAANRLGVWNCALPYSPELKTIKAKFILDGDKSFKPMTAYLVDQTHHTVQRFMLSRTTELSFDPASNNAILVADQKGNFYLANKDQFAEIDADSKTATFNLQVLNGAGSEKESLQQLLID